MGIDGPFNPVRGLANGVRALVRRLPRRGEPRPAI